MFENAPHHHESGYGSLALPPTLFGRSYVAPSVRIPSNILPPAAEPIEKATLASIRGIVGSDQPRYSDSARSGTRCLVIGEWHEHEDQIAAQCRLIEALKPQCVLFEYFKSYYLPPNEHRLVFLPERSDLPWYYPGLKDDGIYPKADVRKCFCYATLEPLLHAASRVGAPIIGCDLSKGEFRAATKDLVEQFPDRYELKYGRINDIRKRVCLVPEQWDDVLPYREVHMARQIAAALQATTGWVVAIVGEMHLTNIRNQGRLEDLGCSYFGCGFPPAPL